MRRRTVVVAALGFGAGLLLFATFLVGVYVGSYQLMLMDSSAKASLLVAELKALRAGTSDKVIQMKELELDAAIVQALRFEHSGHPWIFWPFAANSDNERYLRTVAAYRKLHPSPAVGLWIGENPEQKKMMEAYDMEVKQRTAQLLERYGE